MRLHRLPQRRLFRLLVVSCVASCVCTVFLAHTLLSRRTCAVRVAEDLCPAQMGVVPEDPILRAATVVVLTMTHPHRVVHTIHCFYPTLRVLTLDSHGRNQLLDQVSTPFVVVAEEAYVSTRIPDLLRVLDVSGVDIASGVVGEHHDHALGGFRLLRKGHFLYQIDEHSESVQGCHVVDVVPNFFVARTDRLRLVRWDDTLRRYGAHEDFFLRAKGLLTTVCCPHVMIRRIHESSSSRSMHIQQAFLRKHRLLWYLSQPPDHRVLAKLHSPLSHRPTVTSFFLIWTRDPSALRPRDHLALESIFFHHPNAVATIYSNTLPPTSFRDLVDAGFQVQIQPYGLDSLCPLCPGSKWLDRLEEWREGPFFSLHEARFLQFTLLYRDGGTFLGFDHLVLRPVHDISNGLGVRECERDEEWCSPLEHVGRSPKRYELSSDVLVAFDPHSPLLEGYLRNFESHYDPACEMCTDAPLLTRSYQHQGMERVHVMHPFALYPTQPAQAEECLEGMDDALRERIEEQTFIFRLHETHTKGRAPSPGSLTEYVVQHNCIFCEEL